MAKVIEEQRKRGSERDLPETEYVKPLKPARSKAELTRVRQGWLQIGLTCVNIGLVITLLILRLS